MSSIWLNDTTMIPIITNSVSCNNVTCQTMTCQTMDITNLDFTTITGNECDFNNVNCGNLGATGPSNLNSITGTSLTINNDTVLNNLRIQTLTINNGFFHAVVHDPTTTQIFFKNDFVDTTQTQTLLNKTLTAPVISSVISSGNVVTFPAVAADLIGKGTVDKISNKSFYDDFNDIIQFSDETIKLKFKCAGLTNTTTTIQGSQTANITVTLPSTAGQIALITDIPSPATYITLDGVQTLTNKTLTAPVISSIVNTGTLTLPTTTDTLIGRDTTDTLTNKTITQPRIAQILNGTGTLTLPINTTTTLATTNDLLGMVTQTGSQVLTNKTINTNGPNSILVNNVLITNLINQDVRTTSGPTFASITTPTINNTGALTLPTTTDTLTGRATADTLTNKTINSSSNTLQVNGTNINSLINQDVRNTASPVFVNPVANSLRLNNSIGSKKYEKVVWSVTSTDNSVLDVLTINVNNNSAATVTTTCTFYVSLGTNINKAGSRIFTTRGSNVAGAVTMSGIIQNLSNNEGGLNAVTVNHQAITSTIRVTFAGLIGDTMFASGTTEIFYN